MSYLFLSQDIKQNVPLSSYLDDCVIRLTYDHPLKQWSTGRKRGKDGNTKIRISRERKELFG